MDQNIGSASHISGSLAEYWYKFSIRNNRASVNPRIFQKPFMQDNKIIIYESEFGLLLSLTLMDRPVYYIAASNLSAGMFFSKRLNTRGIN